MTTLERALIGLLAFIGAVLLAFWAGQENGKATERTAWAARINEERATAAKEARQAERDQQAGVNDALERKNRTLAGINARLAADLERLRQRPERPSGVSEAPRPDCQGANGAELGGEHASFLAGFAAMAAGYDAELRRCYESYDAVTNKQ